MAVKLILSNGMNENPGISKKMIVICDDNASLAMLMKHLLQKKGFSVQTAGDGSEGLSLVRATTPDILLLDLAMPGTDGLSVLEAMQGFTGKRPYTIVITGQKGAAGRERAATLGSNEVWEKPFNTAQLIGRLEGLIAQGKI
jgi:DNA-binding response OmpR family regulator